MKEKKKMSKATKQLFVLAFTLVLLIAGSYAWLTLQVTGNKTNILRAGTLKLTLDDTTSNGILLEKAVPMSDTKGKTTTEYTFTLQNSGSIASDYKIYLDDVALSDGETRLEDSKVKYQLIKNGEETVDLLDSLDNKVLDSGTIGTNKTNTYSLRVWIDSIAENEVMQKILYKELRVEATQAKQIPTAAKSFADDSWDTIATAVEFGTYPYQVGDTKEVDMGDLGIHTVRVANTSECTNGETSQTACGFVVEFANIITTQKMNSTATNVGGWPASELRVYVNSTVYNALPSDLQNVITETSVVSSHGSRDSSNFTSTDKLYLLSAQEVWGSSLYDTVNVETRQLDYYKNKGTTKSSYSGSIKQYNGSNTRWWLRSATSNGSVRFITVNDNGGWIDPNANLTYGVSPAFRIA